MINLIKNELTKIFHKKAIYILAIITVLFTLLSGAIIKFALNIDSVILDDSVTKMLEDGLKNYDLEDPEQLEYYVDDLTTIDATKLMKKYDRDSWQYYRVSNYGYDYLHSLNEAKYISKDKEEIKEAEEAYNNFVKEIDEHDWQYFVNNDLAQAKEQKDNILESLKNEELSDNEKLELNKNLNDVNYRIEGYEYRLNLKIPNDGSSKSMLVDQYVANAIQYQGMNKDESQIKDYDDLLMKREVEEAYYVSKYKLENKMEETDMFSTSQMFLGETTAPVLFVIVAIIMIAGSIVADEFNKGTVKQLLLRPYKRWKILLSKYLTAIIVFLLFLVFYEVVTYVTYGAILGFDSYKIPIVLYSFTSHKAFEMSVFANMLVNLLSILPAYLIILTLTFFIGILTTNGGVSIAVGFLVFFFGNILNQMASVFNTRILAFIPTMCWNFNEYLYGGLPSYKYSNLGLSITISLLTFLIFLIGSFIVFKKKDIKNQ